VTEEPIVSEEQAEVLDPNVLEVWATASGKTTRAPRKDHNRYASEAGWWCLGPVESKA
jgi:hypothetical protein